MSWKIYFVIGFAIGLLLLVGTPFSFLNNAEARGADEPCSYLKKYSYIKISAEPLNCKKVDYRVPEECGRVAGLYLTDIRCQAPAPAPTVPVRAAAMPNPTSHSGTSYYLGVNDLHTSSQQVNCGAGTVLKNNSCVVVDNTDVTLPAFPEINLPVFYPENIPLVTTLCGIPWGIFLVVYLYRRRSQRRDYDDRDVIELRTDGSTQRSTTIANPNTTTVTLEVANRIREYENDFKTMGQSDPEYFLVKWNAEFIDSSKRGNELYANRTIIPGRTLKLVKYPDTSTGQLYLVHVPDGINDPDDGVGWTLGLSGDDYRRMGDEA